MKEVKEWNGKPRWMWVWDNNEECKHRAYVIYILTAKEEEEFDTLPVITPDSCYKHCAEIEEETTRLTHYELSQLAKCLGVEVLGIPSAYKIRYRQGEWEEPTRETVMKWVEEKVKPSELADIVRFVSFIGWDKE